MAESSPWRVVARRAVLATLTRYGENALDVIHVVKERIGAGLICERVRTIDHKSLDISVIRK